MKRLIFAPLRSALLLLAALPALATAQDAALLDLTGRSGARFNHTFSAASVDFTAKDSAVVVLIDPRLPAATAEIASYACTDAELTCADGSLTVAVTPASDGWPSPARQTVYAWNLRVYEAGTAFYDSWIAGRFTMKAPTDPGATSSGGTTTVTVTTGTLATVTITAVSTATSAADDAITPDAVLSTGQTDEYVLTYEATGDTWEWQVQTGGYATIQDEGSSLTQRTAVNFTGAGITCVDNSGSSRTDCTVTSGGGSGTMTTVKEADTPVGGADIVTLDFGAGFDVAESPDTEVQITLDLTEKQVNLSAEVTGTLPIGNGGTGVTSLADLVTPAILDDDANTPVAGSVVIVETGAASFDYLAQASLAAGTAATLAANGANCSAGSYPLGVDASGVAENCTDATTEINSAISTHTADASAHHTATVDTDFTDTVTHEQIPFERSTAVAGTDSLKWDGSTGTLALLGDITIDGTSVLTTETNDLSAAVTWANVPDANVDGSSERDEVCGTTTLSSSCEVNTDAITPALLDDDANTPVAGYAVIVETGSVSFDYLDLSAIYQGLDADLTDLADGTLTGSKVGTGIDDDNVSFDDANSDFAATTIGAAVEELVSVNGSGVNAADGKVEWSQLVGVPAGFADGTDDGAGGSGDAVSVEESGTITAAADPVFADSVQINFGLNATPTYDRIFATIVADAVTAAEIDETDDYTWSGTFTVPEATVTAHEAALTITESQISDLAHTTDTGDEVTIEEAGTITATSGPVFADSTDINFQLNATPTYDRIFATVTEAGVTQHQAALSITESQISDLGTYLTAETNNLETDGAANIADTEIFIGTGAGTGNYAAISGDASLANTGALTVTDDSHAHTTTTISGIDIGDDTNLAAGRSLTLTGDQVDADAELYTDQKCSTKLDPATDEEFYTVWRAPVALTITEIYCEVTGGTSVALDFEIDDGTPTGVNGSDITCTTSGVTDGTLAGDTGMAAGDRLDIDFGTVTGSVTQVSMCILYTVDD